jgi:hypothetical protein
VLIVSVDEINEPPSFSVFPNPSNDVFNVQMNKFKNMQMKVYNISGECIYQQIGKSTNLQIDLSSQPNGIYFLQMQTEQGISTQKLIIQK